MRLTAGYFEDDVGQVDVRETAPNAELFSELDYGTASAPQDISTGEHILGLESNNDGGADCLFQPSDTTGPEGGPVQAYADLRGTVAFVFISMPMQDQYTSLLPAPTKTDGSTSTASVSVTDHTASSDTLTLSASCLVLGVTADVDITHAWAPDMNIWRPAPAGRTMNLHDDGYGTYDDCPSYGSDYGSDDLIGSYATDETGSLDAAGELNDFLLLDGTGDWTLEIYDGGTSDTRTLNVWGVQLDCRQRGVRHRRIQGVPRGQRPD